MNQIGLAERCECDHQDDNSNSRKIEKRPLYNALKVLQTFNSWAFKRQQPTEPALLLETIERAIANMAPVGFVLYWGKGPRSSIASPDIACLNYLAQMIAKIEREYQPGATLTLITTDTHALHNGHAQDVVYSYFNEVAAAAQSHGFSCVHLSEVVEAARDFPDETDAMPEAGLLTKLEKCASKWYRGGHSITAGAAAYYRLNMLEKQAVELAFPGHIFTTFNNSDYRELFPKGLPVFYMYSLRKGFAAKPWFLDSEQCITNSS